MVDIGGCDKEDDAKNHDDGDDQGCFSDDDNIV